MVSLSLEHGAVQVLALDELIRQKKLLDEPAVRLLEEVARRRRPTESGD